MSTQENITFEYKNDTITAHVSGDIDHHRAKALREAMDARLYADRPPLFLLNMSRVAFMDSSGLGLILGRFTLCRELSIEFRLTDPSPEVEKILDLAGTGRLIRIDRTKNSKSVKN
ncbi:MAG: anti-sigma factor antagonist [Clostridia bacterium]|nr:anti-sigma factor antagonist [Clostridia bacterium]